MRRTGIVLSGGGARGIAHLGVLQALEQKGMRPVALAGTSAGALVAALYAAGSSPEEIKGLFHDTAYFGLSHHLIGGPGLFNMSKMRTALEKHLGFKTFEELTLRLFVAATNLTAGTVAIFSTGPLVEPLMASACVPAVFEPVVYRGCEWVDGGVMDNFPVDPLVSRCDYIVGSHVNRQSEWTIPAGSEHKSQILERCFHLAIARSVYEKAAKCHLFLDHPGLARFRLFDTGRADELFRLGYDYCLSNLP